MPRFFVDSGQIADGTVTLTGEDAHHISRSLRMACGERITVCDGEGTDYLCELTAFLPESVRARVLETVPSGSEPPYLIRVFQGLPKGDKLDEIIRRTVEFGAGEIIPFESRYCVARIGDGERDRRRGERRNRIAAEAAKQCGRGRIPRCLPALPFSEAVGLAAGADLALFCYEGAGTRPLRGVLEQAGGDRSRLRSVSVMVGSEGGFSPEEAEQAARAGMLPVGLGPRILRTENAAAFVLACLCCALEMEKDPGIC